MNDQIERVNSLLMELEEIDPEMDIGTADFLDCLAILGLHLERNTDRNHASDAYMELIARHNAQRVES